MPIKIKLMDLSVRSGECRLWTAAINKHGYGLVKIHRKTYLAHRVSYKEFIGEIPEGLLVCHRCDVRCCIETKHLFAGTNQDNIRDALTKGRLPLHNLVHVGESNPKSILTAEKVLEILKETSNGTVPLQLIADKYGVSRSTISAIVHDRMWRALRREHGYS